MLPFRHALTLTLAALCAESLVARSATLEQRDAARARALAARTVLNKTSPSPATLLVEPTRTVEARLGFAAEVPDLLPTSWIVFAAVPPNHPTQRVSMFNVSPKTMEVADDRISSRKLLMTILSGETDKEAHKLKIGAVYRLQLFKRTLIPATSRSAPADLPPSNSPELFQSLVPTETLDFDSPAFQDSLARNSLRPVPGESELDFARRAFTTLKPQLRYEYRGEMDRHSSTVWQTGKSDCAGLNGLYVAVLRANGIPARNLCGRWARSAKDGDTLGGIPYAQWHVKAEFFLKNTGWIPVDLSGAVQCAGPKDNGLAFFGSDHGDFITMHTDLDFNVDALQFGKQHLIADQGFAYWVTGTGTMAGQSNHEYWHVDDVSPLAKAP